LTKGQAWTKTGFAVFVMYYSVYICLPEYMPQTPQLLTQPAGLLCPLRGSQ